MNKNKLTCTVTGKTVGVAPKIFDQRSITYGSAENLRLNYISALGRSLLCQGKTVDEIRAEFNVDVSVPIPSIDVVSKYTRWAKYRLPKTIVTPSTDINEQAKTI